MKNRVGLGGVIRICFPLEGTFDVLPSAKLVVSFALILYLQLFVEFTVKRRSRRALIVDSNWLFGVCG